MCFVSYAQNYEDVVLYRALGDVDQGFYVDVGAADPTEYSVTRAFYERGWRGINIEPYAQYFERLEQERSRDINLQIVAAGGPGLARFYIVEDSGLSTIDPVIAETHRQAGWTVRETSAPARPLSTVCKGQPVIHFLKIDVEGAEADVLAGMNFAEIRPWIVLVEATRPLSSISTRDKWEHLITRNGYNFTYFDGLNAFYVAEEHADRGSRLAVPPNVFDNFIQANELAVRDSLATMTTKVSRLESEVTSTQEQLAIAQVALSKLQARVSNAEAELPKLRRQLGAAQTELSGSRTRMNDLTALLQQQTEKAAEHARLLQAILHSHSWRMTRPVRAISILARRVVVPRMKHRLQSLAPLRSSFILPPPMVRGGEPLVKPSQSTERFRLDPDFGAVGADWSVWTAARSRQGKLKSHHEVAWIVVCGCDDAEEPAVRTTLAGIPNARIATAPAGWGAARLQEVLAHVGSDDLIVVLRAGDRPGVAFGSTLDAFAGSTTDIAVCDADFVQDSRIYPFLQPGFNPPYLRSFRPAAERFLLKGNRVRSALPAEILGDAADVLHALLANGGLQGMHIPELAFRIAETREHLADERLKLLASRQPVSLPEDVSVTVVICTHQKGHLLRQLVNTLTLSNSLIQDVIIVSHEVSNAYALETLRFVKHEPRVRVLSYHGPFNFSRMSNMAAAAARGTHLLFLNDDIVPISEDWLGQMLRPFNDPALGATGPLLLYHDETVQHAGMFLGFNNIAGHTLRGAVLPDGDYMAMASAPRAVSCLTGAALMVERRLFEDLNGFDPMLGTSLQDVDLCLRIRCSGRKLLFTPHAVLLHLESTTLRPLLEKPAMQRTRQREYEYFASRWAAAVQADPFHNPAFLPGDESLRSIRPRPQGHSA